MKSYPIVEPAFLPAIFLRDFVDDRCQPTRQRVLKFGYVDILGGKPEIARQHECRAAIDGDLQLRSRQHCRPTDLIKRV